MSNDKTTLADVQPGGKVRLATVPFDRAHDLLGDAYNAGTHGIGYSQQAMELHDAIFPAERSPATCKEVLQVQPSPRGEGDALDLVMGECEQWFDTTDVDLTAAAESIIAALAARQPVEESDACLLPQIATERMLDAGWPCGEMIDRTFDRQGAYADLVAAAPASARQAVGRSFQAGVAEWMGQCFLPSLYSNMTERGDRLLEEVLELLQANGYDSARVPTLVNYVFGRPVGEPAQEVGGVMVTLAGYCWVAGLDMHAAGDAELARISQPEVMAKIRAKQEAKNALHFDTPLPGNAARQPVGEQVIDHEDLLDQAKDLIHCGCSVNGAFEWLLEQLTDGEAPAAQPAPAVDLGQPDPTLLRFYQVSDFPSLVTALEAHVLQLIDLRKRSIKPWEDTMPPTLLPKWVRENSPVLAKDLLALAEKWQDEAAATWGESPAHAAKQQCFDELHALIDSKAVGNG